MNALRERTGHPAPPHVPTISSETDLSNFDHVPDEEEEDIAPEWRGAPSRAQQELFASFEKSGSQLSRTV